MRHDVALVLAFVLAPVPIALAPLAPPGNPLLAWVDPTLAAQLPRRDSLHLLSRAHDAQFHFEIYRREHLPYAEPSDPETCDYTIGRMCYWHEDGDLKPPGEPRAVVRARLALVRTLGALAERSRADGWIVGERVHYLVEAGEDSAALVAARECWAAAWWCAALRGYAYHAGGDYVAAGVAFDSALATMPPDSACRWRDLSPLLDDDEIAAYRKLSCAARAGYEQRFWDLSDPSYAIPGNDRRTEHFSRMVLAALAADAENPYALRWGDDMRELIVRYGAPAWYVQPFTDPYQTARSVEGHDRQPSFHFVPHLGPDDSVAWDLRDPKARERYAPPYLDSLVALQAQFTMVRRGDSALVIAVYADTTGGRAVLGVADSGVTTLGRSDGTHVRVARAAWRGVVAGVETYDPVHRIETRARVWLAPPAVAPGAPVMSPLLLYAADTAGTAETLTQALALALPGPDLRGTRRLGVYWETYGPAPAAQHGPGSASPTASTTPHDSAAPRDSTPRASAQGDSAARSDVALSVTPEGGGLLHRLAQALHIVSQTSPLVIHWHDATLSGGGAARSVVLDLSTLPAGRYLVSAAVGNQGATGPHTMATREIRLR